MAKYHINPNTGNPGKCHAFFRCPFGSAHEHYSSAEEARSAYEAAMTPTAPVASKNTTELTKVRNVVAGDIIIYNGKQVQVAEVQQGAEVRDSLSFRGRVLRLKLEDGRIVGIMDDKVEWLNDDIVRLRSASPKGTTGTPAASFHFKSASEERAHAQRLRNTYYRIDDGSNMVSLDTFDGSRGSSWLIRLNPSGNVPVELANQISHPGRDFHDFSTTSTYVYPIPAKAAEELLKMRSSIYPNPNDWRDRDPHAQKAIRDLIDNLLESL